MIWSNTRFYILFQVRHLTDHGMDCCTSFPSDVRSLVVVGFVCVALTVLDLEACSNSKANK